MDLDDLERKITNETKIILLVHWGGQPVNLNRIESIKRKTYDKFGFKPKVIEDCAHSFGSTFMKEKLGNHGNICVYSLQAIKHVTAVDGGVMIVPNVNDYKRAKLLRWYGLDRETPLRDMRCDLDVEEFGFKFHMNDVNAVIGMANLEEADSIIKKHRANAKYYDTELSKVGGVTLLEKDYLSQSSYWLYTMLVEKRDDFSKYMKSKGVQVSRVHKRNDEHSCVIPYRRHLPNLDMVSSKMICIPVGWWVNKEAREYIVDCIKKGW
jgi:dTDP-4-amino-4,6-dideoxygalactose transaminase